MSTCADGRTEQGQAPYHAELIVGAVALARLGMRVFPVAGIVEVDRADPTTGAPLVDRYCGCFRDREWVHVCEKPGKHPLIKGWKEKATSDPEQARRAFSRPEYALANLGIATGRESGVFVLDIDAKTGGLAVLEAIEASCGSLPDTLHQRTGSGGLQYVFRWPGCTVRNEVGLFPGVDLRGDGGLAVVAPSRHVSGGVYIWEDGEPGEVPIADAPPWLLDAMKIRKKAGKGGAAFDLPKDVPEGSRNDTLFRLGCSLRNYGYGEAEILATIQVANARCDPPLAEAEIASIVASALKYEPGVAAEGEHPARTASEDLPWIFAGSADLCMQTAAAWKALLAANHPPHLFLHGGLPVRLELGNCGGVALRELTSDRLIHELSRCANWWLKKRGKKPLPAHPSRFVARDVLATAAPLLPVLERIVEVPTFSASGRLVSTPGYDAAAKTYYDPGALTVSPVPDPPTESDLREARRLVLNEALADFPFLGPADLAAAVALLLLPFARDLVDGPTPLHLIDKPSPGTGAGLLVDVIATIVTGRTVEVMSEAREDDEWRKTLTAVLRGAPMLVALDNLRGRLDSAALSAALTARTWKARILGVSDMTSIPVRCGWVATANNAAVSNEIGRRVAPIRLDTKLADPEARDPASFRHHPLLPWVLANRGGLVWAAAVIVQNWIAAGRPPERSVTMGSFESWAETMGGILASAGIPGFLDNAREFRTRADTEREMWSNLLAAWWQKYSEAPVGAGEVFELILAEDLAVDLGKGTERSQKTRLGVLLRRLRDRRFDDLRVEAAGTYQRGARWRLTQVVEAPTPSSNTRQVGEEG